MHPRPPDDPQRMRRSPSATASSRQRQPRSGRRTPPARLPRAPDPSLRPAVTFASHGACRNPCQSPCDRPVPVLLHQSHERTALPLPPDPAPIPRAGVPRALSHAPSGAESGAPGPRTVLGRQHPQPRQPRAGSGSRSRSRARCWPVRTPGRPRPCGAVPTRGGRVGAGSAREQDQVDRRGSCAASPVAASEGCHGRALFGQRGARA